ncbi:ATP-binding protein [Phaeacidiphilus oryzae]|uniref:ATP-binding protein n=1 Tax=Phaeacidiphilus oryzae TaxID=348818 RepID=UPI00068A812D|nr:BTAD domain-containing putative transcriptional regulator [Phaeacidiphilus oryzae]
MRYGILGPVRVERAAGATDGRDGEEIPVRGARLRALLTALAARAGREVSVEALAASVWRDEEPLPADVPAAVQALVGRLRRVLGAEAVASGGAAGGGYRLAASWAEDVDAGRFERLAAEGSAALAAGDPRRAAVLLREALGLWRGEALADLADQVPAARARLEASRAAALEQRLAAELAVDGPAAVLPELGELVEAYPLHEPYRALRIRALAAAGRRAEALDAYEAARTGLADRLGVDPGPELRALHAELLAQDGPGGGPARPPARTEPAVPSAPRRLPPRLSSFVGRDADLHRLRERLCGSRLVTLTGPGGAGKTRLALTAAESLSGASGGAAAAPFPHGVRLAELAPVEDPATIPAAVLNGIGERDTVLWNGLDKPLEPQESLPRLLDVLADRSLLLVLDNCEHLVDAAARFAETLLAACPRVTVLATSREPLNIPGEEVVPVGPLPPADALRLFEERAAAAGRPPTPADRPAAEEICTRLDGLPLAIELAAARLRMLSPQQIADRLDDRFRLLTSGARTVLPRQQTLRAVVDWSWELLDAEERRLLARLSVFVGGFTLEAAEAVLGADAFEPLAALVDKSLVAAVPAAEGRADGAAGPRYRLLETIREYAGERLREEGRGPAEAARDAHAAHYADLVAGLEPRLRDAGQLAALAEMETELSNIRAALRRLLDAGTPSSAATALRTVNALSWLWQLRSYADEAAAWFTEALEANGWGLPESYAAQPPLSMTELLSWRPEEPEEASEPLPFTIDPYDPLDRDRMDACIELMMCGQDSATIGRWRRWFARLAQEITPIARETDYGIGYPGMMFVPIGAFMRGDFQAMSESLEDQVRRCRASGKRWELAMLLSLRSRVPLPTGDRAEREARRAEDAAEALEIFTALGDRIGINQGNSAVAETLINAGRTELAREHIAAAMAAARELEARGEIPELHLQLATAWNAEGNEREALREAHRALELAEELAVRDVTTFARIIVGEAERRAGNLERAWELLSRAEGQKDLGTPPPFFECWLRSFNGSLLADEGRYAEAVAQHRRGLESLDFPWTEGNPAWQMLAAAIPALRGAGEPERAAELLGAAAAWGQGVSVPPHDVRMVEAERAALREALGESALDAATARGAELDKAGVLALVDSVLDDLRSSSGTSGPRPAPPPR